MKTFVWVFISFLAIVIAAAVIVPDYIPENSAPYYLEMTAESILVIAEIEDEFEIVDGRAVFIGKSYTRTYSGGVITVTNSGEVVVQSKRHEAGKDALEIRRVPEIRDSKLYWRCIPSQCISDSE